MKDILATALESEISMRGRILVQSKELEHQLTTIAGQLTEPGHRFGLLFYGGCGNGKTTMTRAIQQMINVFNDRVFDYDERVGMRILSAKEIVTMRVENPKRWQEFCCQAQLLAIDDLGMEPTEVQEYGNIITPMVDLLSYRYDRRLFTVITTNMTPTDITSKYGGRIADRLREMLQGLYFENPSFRT